MMAAMVPLRLPAPAPSLPTAPSTPTELVGRFFASFKGSTLRSYRQALADFAAWIGEESPESAVARLLRLAPGQANGTALDYRNAMAARGLSVATIALRLAALRSVVKLARMLGLITWS